MPVPDYQALMLPLLKALADGKPHAYREVRDRLASDFKLTPDDLAVMLPSGKQSAYSNRFGWAKTYLSKAGLVATPSRGILLLTAEGSKTLASNVVRVDNAYLRRFPSFTEFQSPKDGNGDRQVTESVVADADGPTPGDVQQKTPDESIDATYVVLRQELEAQLLEQVRGASPRFFEQLVVDLLVKMGYGGTHEDAGEAIGRTGDGGIDGIIKEDRLGLDAIYVQAKRWTNTVGRPDVQAFAGSLQGFRAKKGVFITTSTFSAEARDFVSRIDTRIVLIDGKTLVRLMFDFGLGVSTVKTYEIKRIDSDYFEEA